MRTRIPGVMRAVQAMTWAIMPDKLEAILDMLELRASGIAKSDDEIRAVMSARREAPKAAGKIAVLPLYGCVTQRANLMTEYSGGTSTEQFAASFDAAVANADVGAIVIDCDSPGGSTDGVPELAARIRAARGKKRIIAVANTMMASAAYWICAQADEIVAAPSALTGSIGVFMCHVDESGADEKAGITRTLISAGKYKTEGNPYKPLSDDALAATQAVVDEFYSLFVADVAKGRGVKAKEVENGYGQGRALPARQALAAGLVDRIGTLEDVLAELGAPGSGVNGRNRAAAERPALAAAAAVRSPDTVSVTVLGAIADAERELVAAIPALALVAAKRQANPPVNDGDGPDEEDEETDEEDFVAGKRAKDATDAEPGVGDDGEDEEDDDEMQTGKKSRTARSARALTVVTGGAVATTPPTPAANRPTVARGSTMDNSPTATELVAQERKRAKEIRALCAENNIAAARTEELVDSGVTVAEASHAILTEKRAAQASNGSVIRVGADREAEKPFASFGEQLVAAVQAGMPGRRRDPRLAAVNNRVMAGSPSGMNESVGSEGGFFIQPDLLPGVIDPVYVEDPILKRVTRIPIGAQSSGVKYNVVDETARTTGSRWGGIQMAWGAEADQLSASKAKLRQMQLDLKKLIGAAYLTDELTQDAPAAEALLSRGFQAELSFMLGAAIFSGTGAGQPLGFMKSGALVTQAIEATQTIANSANFLSQNVPKMLARIPASLWGEVIWLYNQELLPYLLNATTGTNGTIPVFIAAGGMTNRPFDTILGRPAFGSELCEAVGTPGDLVAIAPSQYHMADKGGPQQATSLHVRFLYDEMTLRITYRTDGAPVWKQAVTPYKGANARSPFVVLGARS